VEGSIRRFKGRLWNGSNGNATMGKTTDRLFALYPKVSIWAAGGIVIRKPKRHPELLLVYRSDRNDWTFPKGKIDPGETLRRCALREVREETGIECRTLDYAGVVTYRSGRRQRKAVAYWLMRIESGTFEPNDEVDAIGWFDPLSARAALTYSRDRELLDRILPAVLSSTITT